jgi:hypothetical protein
MYQPCPWVSADGHTTPDTRLSFSCVPFYPACPLCCPPTLPTGLSGFVDVLSRWAANMPQQQLAQAFKLARRRETKAAAAAAAGSVDPAAALVAVPAPSAVSSEAAAAAPGVPEAAQQAAAAGSGSSGANGRARLAAVCPAGTSAGLIDGSESSSGCDSSDDEGEGSVGCISCFASQLLQHGVQNPA